jgi:hypothetical protein
MDISSYSIKINRNFQVKILFTTKLAILCSDTSLNKYEFLYKFENYDNKKGFPILNQPLYNFSLLQYFTPKACVLTISPFLKILFWSLDN